MQEAPASQCATTDLESSADLKQISVFRYWIFVFIIEKTGRPSRISSIKRARKEEKAQKSKN